ncbi:Glycosylphosphatidylinositol anchor attachment 1 protein [Sparganum proliferum]
MRLGKVNQFATPLGFLFYFVGVTWFFLLSQDEFSYETYLSENALLVGVVDETFKSDNAMFEINGRFANLSSGSLTISEILRLELLGAGLEVYEQEFTYSHKLFAGETVTGRNVYAIMRSRSGSHTEALVIMAPLRVPTSSDSVATSYTFITSVAKHLRNLIFLFPDMDYIGLLAWLDAYHGVRTTKSVIGAELLGRAGSIQAGVNIEFSSLFMDGIDISYQGVNGELPNLDIINTLKRLAAKLRVPVSLHGQWLEDLPYATPAHLFYAPHPLNSSPTASRSYGGSNVQSHNRRGNRSELNAALITRELARYKVDISALTETRFSEQGQLEEVGAGYTFCWSGHHNSERRDAGVAFAIRNYVMGRLSCLPQGINDRQMSLPKYL